MWCDHHGESTNHHVSAVLLVRRPCHAYLFVHLFTCSSLCSANSSHTLMRRSRLIATTFTAASLRHFLPASIARFLNFHLINSSFQPSHSVSCCSPRPVLRSHFSVSDLPRASETRNLAIANRSRLGII